MLIVVSAPKNVMGQWQSEACSQHRQMLETQTAFFLHLTQKTNVGTIVNILDPIPVLEQAPS